jgi:hypothetical protein
MRRTVAAIGTVAVVALMAAGCSSSGKSDSSSAAETATTAVPALTTAELQPLVLTASDLGTDWVSDTSSSSNSSTSPSCLKSLTSADGGAGASVEAQFKSGETVFAYEGLGSAPGAAAAATAYEQVTSALDSCQDLTFSSDGTPVSATINSTGSAGVGDQSAGYSMAFTASGVPVTLDLVVAQVGSVDMIVMYGYAGATAGGNVNQLATAAVKKVQGGSPA